MSEKMIELKNIDLSYATKYQTNKVLNNFNLVVVKGEYKIIMGKSGCGKSSILNLIAGFVKPQLGSVVVGGDCINDYNDDLIAEYRNKKIGYIHQAFNLIYQFTVEENVMAPMLVAGMKRVDARKRAGKLLKDMLLLEKANNYPNELSGGEQQRVGIARALANNPDIILADEPTGNLDKNTGNIIMDVFDSINKQGKTIVLVTHDVELRERATNVVDL